MHATAGERTPYPLDRALPTDVLAGRGGWLGYRRYPVFGTRWLLGRSLMFALGVGALASMTGLGMALTVSPRVGVLSGLHFFSGFMLMACTGPLLATLVRHRRWPLPRERVAVVVALLIGLVVSYFADAWASGYLKDASSGMHGVEATLKPPKMSAFVQALTTTVNAMTLVAIYGGLGGLFALRAYFRELHHWREVRHSGEVAALRAEKQQVDLRLGVLQAQIEPHFLFNTLASVRALVRQDAARAEATLDALVDYLRATIPKFRDDELALHSTLGQQLDLCAHYLEVMRLRTAGRLQYAIEVAPALRETPFPPLLLITLVENAIKHGIEPKPGLGRVTISAAQEDGQLRVSVIDDGLGLRPGLGGGIGLTNVRAQLASLYRDRARFELRGEAGQGARAELWMPMPEAGT